MINRKKNILKPSFLLAITAITALLLTVVLFTSALAQEITVYKSPFCGCCSKWVDHVRDAGFEVKIQDVENPNQIRTQYGVPKKLTSCHTAVVEGYVLEGHVPADTIKRLLAERPDVKGIAVPGMPVGAPGMEPAGSYPGHESASAPYDVLTFDAAGNTTVYESR